MSKLIEVSVAAKKLCVSERTIYRMLRDPDSPLEGVNIYKSTVRVFLSSIEACKKPISAKNNNHLATIAT